MSRAKRHLFRAAAALLTLTVLEIVAWGAGRLAADRYGLLYRPYGDAVEYALYLRDRHPVLGWPIARAELNLDRDPTGSRILPAFPDPERAPTCISLYGDSFTYAAEVDHAHAWGNVLAQLCGCRVANYGMGGYGTDQAYLRYKLNDADHAGVVVLGIFSENVMRNVNRYRNLFYPSRFGMKPRFLADGEDGLELVPLPEVAVEDYERFIADPDPFLPHEFFTLAGASGEPRLAFPYLLSVAKAATHFRVRAAITGTPHWAPFYREDHPSDALRVTERIASAFREEVVARGAHPLVVMLPHAMDLAVHGKSGSFPYESLRRAMERRGLDVVDIGAEVVARRGEGASAGFAAGQHYDEQGYRFVAETVFARLRERGLVPVPPRREAPPREPATVGSTR